MKKFLFYAVIAIAFLASCEKNDVDSSNGGNSVTPPDGTDGTIVLVEQSLASTWRQGYDGLGADRYFIGLCDTHIENVNDEYVPEESDGTLFWCAFYGAPADPDDLTLPSGTYTLKNDEKEIGVLDSFYTYISRRSEDSTPVKTPVKSAVVTVEEVSGVYKITFDYTLVTDECVKAVYEGDLVLQKGTRLTAPTPWIEDDYQAEFIGVHANLMGGSTYTKDADIIGVQLYDYPQDDQGRQVEGILVKLELTAPELSGIDPVIPDGTYTVSMGTEMYSTPVGDVLNLGEDMGGFTMMGTTARLVNEDGEYEYSAILSGTVTIATVGMEQTISVDLVDGNGVKITGDYCGPVFISGYVYTPSVSDEPFSTLTEDKDIVADANWSFTAEYYESYYSGRTDVSFIRLRGYSVADPIMSWDPYYGFRFDLNVENDGVVTLPSGTYYLDSDDSYKPMTFIKGTRESGDGGTYYNGSYGYLGYDWLGYIDAKNLAPASDGKLTIKDCGNNEFEIDYLTYDDKGNKVSFSHKATIKIVKR
ncbi:MAG: hypothetical protein E7117_06815 [Bacteroidales bacterium]|nr:hypothetical protein [Bacteroidales bacterium]